MVAPRWLSMKLPTFSATQKGIAPKKPMRKPIRASRKAASAKSQRSGSPGGMVAWMAGRASTAKAKVAARRATPGIMVSARAGQMAKAAPMRAIARTAERIQRWKAA